MERHNPLNKVKSMTNDEYYNSEYGYEGTEHDSPYTRTINLHKLKGSEFVTIRTRENVKSEDINIRSKKQAEHLHFMLGQMLYDK